MSTRSMVLVEQRYSGDQGKFVPLYRHCDGYPGEAGAALLEAVNGAQDAEEIVCRLLAMRHEGHAKDTTEPTYRLATWMPEEQGDLEHVYIAYRESYQAPWMIRHYARGRVWDKSHDDYRKWWNLAYSLSDFVRVVNQDRREMNARLAQLAKTSGGIYAQAEPYPMLAEIA